MTLLQDLLEKKFIAFDFYTQLPSSPLIFSFSLFGTDEYYLNCGLRQFNQILEHHPSAIIIVHTSSYCYNFHNLSQYSSSSIYFLDMGDECIPFEGLYWRHFVAEFGFPAYCVRDIDAYWGLRDSSIINHWLSLTSLFHIIRDGNGQKSEIMCGLWGGKSNRLIFIDRMLSWILHQHNLNRSVEYDLAFFSQLHSAIHKYSTVYTSSNIYLSDTNIYLLSLPSSSTQNEFSHFCGQQPHDLLYTSTSNSYDQFRTQSKLEQRIFNNSTLANIDYLPLTVHVSPFPSINIFKSLAHFFIALFGLLNIKRLAPRLFLSYIYRYIFYYRSLISYKIIRSNS